MTWLVPLLAVLLLVDGEIILGAHGVWGSNL